MGVQHRPRLQHRAAVGGRQHQTLQLARRRVAFEHGARWRQRLGIAAIGAVTPWPAFRAGLSALALRAFRPMWTALAAWASLAGFTLWSGRPGFALRAALAVLAVAPIAAVRTRGAVPAIGAVTSVGARRAWLTLRSALTLGAGLHRALLGLLRLVQRLGGQRRDGQQVGVALRVTSHWRPPGAG